MDQFLHWAALQGIRLHEQVGIQESSVGGYGIISQAPLSENTIILRTPKTAVFDLSTCLTHKTRLEQSGLSCAAGILNLFLGCSESVSETLILRNYIWAFASLSHIMDILFQPYLDVLETTQTLQLDESLSHGDAFLEHQRSLHKAVERDYERAMATDIDMRRLLSFEQALQLHKAVVSRVLEIPTTDDAAHVSNLPKTETASGVHNTSEDFFANISLVPMLDFANHSAASVGVFDVDLASGDVILRLTQRVEALSEITISYDPLPSVTHFFGTYGFVPSDCVHFTWPIDNLDQAFSEITGRKQPILLIAKWLQVVPAVTMTFTEDKFLLDIHPRFPALLIEGLEYYAQWSTETADLEEEFPTQPVVQTIAQLRHHELSSPIVPARETAFGVLYKDVYVSIPYLMEQTGNSAKTDPEIVNGTALLIRRAAQVSVEGLDSVQEALVGIMQYRTAKKRFLEKLLTFLDQDLTDLVKNAIEME